MITNSYDTTTSYSSNNTRKIMLDQKNHICHLRGKDSQMRKNQNEKKYKKNNILMFLISATLFTLIPLKSSFADITSEKSVNKYLHFMGNLNTVYTNEGAYCHGSYGINLGVGAQQQSWDDESNLIQENLYLDSDQTEDSSILFPRITIIKGLSIPVDFVLAYAQLDSKEKIDQWSGFIHWSFFQRFRFPALAFRAGYSKITGVRKTSINTSSAALSASYSFLRYFTLYGNYTLLYQRAELAPLYDTKEVFTMNTMRFSSTKESWFETNRSFGLKIQLPGSISISGEMQRSSNSFEGFSGKISYIL